MKQRSLTTKSSKTLVASLTVIRENGRRTIVEIHRDATFHQFFRFFVQDGNRWSTKTEVRTASRNEGLPIINAHLHKPGLEVIERRLHIFNKSSNPVVSSKIRIFKKRLYKKLLSARPDELGQTRLTHRDLNAPKPIRVSIPSYDWVRSINRRALRRGAVR